jgi:hypothetical protein
VQTLFTALLVKDPFASLEDIEMTILRKDHRVADQQVNVFCQLCSLEPIRDSHSPLRLTVQFVFFSRAERNRRRGIRVPAPVADALSGFNKYPPEIRNWSSELKTQWIVQRFDDGSRRSHFDFPRLDGGSCLIHFMLPDDMCPADVKFFIFKFFESNL